MSDLWQRRLRRIDTLLAQWPFAGEVLRFLRVVTEFQSRLGEADAPSSLPALLELLRRHGPAALSAALDGVEWKSSLPSYPSGNPAVDMVGAILLATSAHDCTRMPVAGVLREDKEAGAVARFLVCALCSREVPFPRVLCPGCREERPERLPRFTAEEIPWIRVESCDTCRRYLKSIDLTLNPEADPVADEVASTPLDLIARERGYEKLRLNVLGI